MAHEKSLALAMIGERAVRRRGWVISPITVSNRLARPAARVASLNMIALQSKMALSRHPRLAAWIQNNGRARGVDETGSAKLCTREETCAAIDVSVHAAVPEEDNPAPSVRL